jgi:Raf kinase inhibitor-like YbhB/YbcL family protein
MRDQTKSFSRRGPRAALLAGALGALVSSVAGCKVSVNGPSNPAGGADMAQLGAVDLGASDLASKGDLATSGLALSSPAFGDNGTIPLSHAEDQQGCAMNGTAAGNNQSPPLAWSGAPAGTKSLAVVMEDLDFGPNFVHWMIWDLPPTMSSLPAGASSTSSAPQAGEYHLGTYGGMCPPPGETHRYRFTIYALDVATLGVPTGSSVAEVRAAGQAHVVAEASLTAKFTN